MAFRHGSRVNEAPTSLSVPVVATATLQVVFGTAPIHLAKTTEYVNEPVIAYSWEEAVMALGYSDDWESFTLCEMMDAAFRQFNVAPVVFVNVLDPEVHNKTGNEEVPVSRSKAILQADGILRDSVKVKLEVAAEPLKIDEDYVMTFNDEGKLVIALITDVDVEKIFVEFKAIDPSLVNANHIIGGFNIDTGQRKGLELLNAIFPKFSLVPGQVLAPKFSTIPSVAAVMKAKASAVNTYFRAFAWDDIDTTVANHYQKANEWKNQNNYVGTNEAPCWPMVALDEKVYHMSTQASCLVTKVASNNGDYPYESPSNKNLAMNKMVLKDGTKVDLGPDQAELLNSQGITTALNFIGGYRLWGNRTGAFPAETDVKDIFIPVRIMHNWIANTIILTTWSKVDKNIRRSLIDNIVDTMNNWFNGLHNANVVLGGRVEFRRADNPITDMLSGNIKLRYFVAESVPAESIENILEFDPTYYNTLF